MTKDELLDYVEFDTAELSKEKGFNINTKECYAETHRHTWDDPRSGEVIFDYIAPRLLTTSHCRGERWITIVCQAPTQAELAKWLRKVHKIHIEIFLSEDSPYAGFYYRVMEIGKYFTTSHDGILFDEYEDAMEKGLIEALKTLKDEKI